MAGCTLHVVSHSHWDREWYLPFEQHRRRLVALLDGVLDILDEDPEFGSFHLDGQMIPIEDYLAIRPHQRERIARAAAAGRLTVGPWYVLQDEFLTSAEAQVRNLLYGLRAAAEFGPPLRVGYLADSFGHIGQMPAILRGFGIDNAVFGRGVNRRRPDVPAHLPLAERGYGSELAWQGSDGSTVLGIFMANWYANAMDIPAEPDACVARFEAIREGCLRYAATPHLLLMNGCDHTPCQLTISRLIATARERLDDAIVHSRLDDYVAAVRAAAGELDLATGELRSEFTDGWGTLTNVLSARLYLKQANHRCQSELEHYLEPLQAVAWCLGEPADRDFRRYLWKLLLENHPHDSICGCSADPVHREMETRFAKVEALAEQLSGEALDRLAARVDTAALAPDEVAVVVYNPLAQDRRSAVQVEVSFPQDSPVQSVRVTDAAGHEVPAWVKEDQGVVWDYELPDDRFRVAYHCRRLTLQILADVPACGWATYRVTPLAAPPAPLAAAPEVLENAWLQVIRHADGVLDVVDKRTGRTWAGLNLLVCDGDAGDEYNYRAPAEDEPILFSQDLGETADDSACPAVVDSWSNALGQGFVLTGTWERYDTTADEQIVPLSTIAATLWVALPVHRPRVDVQVWIHNLNAGGFRLRAHFPTHVATDTVAADGHFEVVRRRIAPWSGWTNPSNCQPCLAFVDVSDQHGGLTIANRGLPEYEVLRDGEQTVALTLLRGVGRIGDWGVFPTPDAQCEGTHLAEYSLIPHAGPLESSGADQEARAFNTPLRAVQTGRHPGDLPPSGSWIRLDPGHLVLSALRVAEDRDAVIARFYNPYDAPANATLTTGLPVTVAWRCNLNEERGEALALTGGQVTLALGPKEIVTVELGRGER